MITANNLDSQFVQTLNDFTKDCQNGTNNIKNGNSLKMEIELELYQKAGKEAFLNSLDYIHERIAKILNNIKITK